METLNMNELTGMIDSLSPEEQFLFEVQKEERAFLTKLKEHREKLELTQEELANKANLTQQTVCRIEKIGSSPSLSTLIKYLKGLDINITDLFNNQ